MGKRTRGAGSDEDISLIAFIANERQCDESEARDMYISLFRRPDVVRLGIVYHDSNLNPMVPARKAHLLVPFLDAAEAPSSNNLPLVTSIQHRVTEMEQVLDAVQRTLDRIGNLPCGDAEKKLLTKHTMECFKGTSPPSCTDSALTQAIQVYLGYLPGCYEDILECMKSEMSDIQYVARRACEQLGIRPRPRVQMCRGEDPGC